MAKSPEPRLVWQGRNSASEPSPAHLSPGPAKEPGPGDPDPADLDPGAPPTCQIIEGDNLLALGCLREELKEKVTLAYLDPPFLTGRQHYKVDRQVNDDGRISRQEKAAFDDRWTSLGDYLNCLEPRLRVIRDLLRPEGSLVLHVDPKTSHYAKVICDEIFGPECFASEVIWRYRRWPSKTRNFQRVHDVMLRYVKDARAETRFNQLYEPLAPSTLRTWGDKKQRAITDETGRRTRSSSTADKSQGTPLGDVWDIGIVAPVARERTGYPTQKPEALLTRWIEACTAPGDLVLDPYMGSGTTLAVAHKLGRRSVGIDLGTEAHQVAQKRLLDLGSCPQFRQVTPPLARARLREPGSRRAAI